MSLVLAALFMAGCGSLRLSRQLREHPDDWPAYARDATHTATSREPLTLPLTLDWMQDVSSGVGNGSPIIVDSVVFIGNLRGELYALSVVTGKSLGWTGMGDAIQGSPVINGSSAFVALSNSKESIASYNLMEGKVRWSKRCGDIEVSPLLYRQNLYAGTVSGLLYCLEASDGETRWKFELPDNTSLKGIRSSAAAESSIVVFGADDGFIYALNAETGILLWKHATGAPVVASPLIVSGMVVVGNWRGTVTALQLGSGGLLWKSELGSRIFAGVVPVGDLLVLGTADGNAIGLRRADGSRAWLTPVGGPVSAGGAVAGDVVYIGTLRKEVVALQGETGALLWKAETSGRVRTSPATAFGRLIVVTDDRDVIAYREAHQ
jgi:outer membrane protein assembly factor BamB